jgi:hypothetical protein
MAPSDRKVTDVLERARLALGIAPEPAAHPLTARGTAHQPAVFSDKAKVASVIERARAASSVRPADIIDRARVSSAPRPEPAAAPAAPQLVKRRVEIMVSGSLSRVGVVRDALDGLQTQLFDQLGSDNLELRVTAFLDGCRHTTPWSRSPIDAGASTNRWHCFQGGTLYGEAFGHTASESDPVDAVVMFGNRFDDNLPLTLGVAERLGRQGTRIYAFHVGHNPRSRYAYEQLAGRTGGAFVQLTNQQSFARVMAVIAAYLVRPIEALRALPSSSQDADVRALIDRLKLQPPPVALRVEWRKS